MQNRLPRLLVMDDERAILSLAGTGISCLDVLKALRGVSPQQCEVMMTSYPSIEAAVDAARRTMEELGHPADTSLNPSETTLLVDVEREHIVRTLRQVRGNKAVAARMLGISRRAFYRQLERHGLHQRTPMTRRGDSAAIEAIE
jgi:two-component system response regulator HydG